jgi:hypothetical protein
MQLFELCFDCLPSRSLPPKLQAVYGHMVAPLLSSLLWLHVQVRGANTFITFLPTHTLHNHLDRPISIGAAVHRLNASNQTPQADSSSAVVELCTLAAGASLTMPCIFPDELPIVSSLSASSSSKLARHLADSSRQLQRHQYQAVIFVRSSRAQLDSTSSSSDISTEQLSETDGPCVPLTNTTILHGPWSGAFPIDLQPTSLVSTADEAWLTVAAPPAVNFCCNLSCQRFIFH